MPRTSRGGSDAGLEGGKGLYEVMYAQLTSASAVVATTVALVGTFFVVGAVSSITTKYLVWRFNFPLFWCCVQFISSYLLTEAYIWCTGKRSVLRIEKSEAIVVTVLNALGFMFHNVSLLFSSAPFVELVRAMEPVTTMIFGRIFLQERPSLRCILAMVPACGGVAMCCRNTSAFSVVGFCILCLANSCFSGRSVATRQLQLVSSEVIDPIRLFASTSLWGLLLLVPATQLLEGSQLTAAFWSSPHHMAWATDLGMVWMIGLHCVASAMVNVLSFVLLDRTDLLSHSIMNVFRRVVAIFCTTAYFGVHMDTANAVGLSVSVLGVLMYSYFRFIDKAEGS